MPDVETLATPAARTRRSAGGSARSRTRASRAAGDAGQPDAGTALRPPADPPPPAASAEAAGVKERAREAAPAQEPKRTEAWLAAARRRHGGTEKEPLTAVQLGFLLDLLHEDGQDRRLVAETYGYLDRGMSKAHASVLIRKLKGEFVETRAAAA